MKRFVSFLMALALTAGLASCSGAGTASKPTGTDKPSGEKVTASEPARTTDKTDDPDTPDGKGTVYPLNESAVWLKKLDPRMEATADGIVCDWSAAGIEFVATGKGDMTFDLTVTTNMGGGKEGCNFRAYVDNAAYLNGDSPYYEVKKGNAKITLKNLPDGTHTIRLVKVTGYTLANTVLKSVTFDGTVAETAPAAKGLYLEFVGDSICCGWGVIGDHKGAYLDQDATMAYPNLIADAMNADLSVVALSGQGLTVGNPGLLVGYKYASPSRSMKTEYDFAREADYSVINVGTNDSFQNLSIANFEGKLKELVAYVREKNGADCRIVLVGGMMKTEYNDTLKRVAKELGGADANYYVCIADQAKGGAHPTIEEHKNYAGLLGGMLDAIEKGTYEEQEVTPRLPLSQDFDSVATPAEAGITGTITPTEKCPGQTGLPLEIRDGKLWISKHAWHQNADYFATLVGADVLAGTKTYLLEMDLTFTELSVFTLILNGDKALSADNVQNNQSGAMAFSLRQYRGEQNKGSYMSGVVAYPIVANFISFDESGKSQTEVSGKNDFYAVDGKQESVSFHLSLLVEDTGDGCRVSAFLNGEFVVSYTYAASYNATSNSAIILWAQDTSLTIDNLKLSVPQANEG